MHFFLLSLINLDDCGSSDQSILCITQIRRYLYCGSKKPITLTRARPGH